MRYSGYKELCLGVESLEVVNGRQGNIIPPPEKESLWIGFLKKFNDPLMIVLLVVFVFSVMVSTYEYMYKGETAATFIEPCGVLIALMLATGVGFWFEVKAAREFDILNQVKNKRKVKVVRRDKDGRCVTLLIPKHDVVVGDIVKLESGDEIPADGKLLRCQNLTVDESNFTGEPFAYKNVEGEDRGHNAAYPANMLLRNSTVIEGSAVIQVTAVGVDTEEGKGVLLSQEDSNVKTPLNRQLDSLGKIISIGGFSIGVLIIVGRMAYYLITLDTTAGFDWVEFFEVLLKSIMIAVALIVMAVPEGLPMSVTLSLALSMRRMLKENNLVRKLHACETMGATTVICTDKTGTLTQNRMTVMEWKLFGETDNELLARSIALNSTATINKEGVVGNPTEGALLKWMTEEGFDYETLRENAEIAEVKPFSTETKCMITTLASGESFIKGAPEVVLSMVRNQTDLNQDILPEWQRKGMRTLAFGYRKTGEEEWQLVGLCAIADPVREDVAEAIRICNKQAGVRVIMVTGDNLLTANEIARQIGLETDEDSQNSITGAEFAKLSDEEAKKLISNPGFKVLSRARPDDKARLVGLLQELGEVVAVTGDGTNDAPALKKAQVGLSMGDGTSRAKEASDITIIDNSFASINTAILWGRSIYLNIKRFLLYQMTINITACLIVLYGAFQGLQSPLNVTQMLWINLIMDTFAAMALSSLPVDPQVMNDKPRSTKANIIDRKMLWTMCGVSIMMFIVLLTLWIKIGHVDDPHERGLFFTFFVLLHFWNIFNTRYFKTRRSLTKDIICVMKRPKSFYEHFSKGFVGIAFAILIGQFLIVNVFGGFFSVSALSMKDWGLMLAVTFPVLVIGELWRAVMVKG